MSGVRWRVRDFRRATISSFNALRKIFRPAEGIFSHGEERFSRVDDGFTEMPRQAGRGRHNGASMNKSNSSSPTKADAGLVRRLQIREHRKWRTLVSERVGVGHGGRSDQVVHVVDTALDRYRQAEVVRRSGQCPQSQGPTRAEKRPRAPRVRFSAHPARVRIGPARWPPLTVVYRSSDSGAAGSPAKVVDRDGGADPAIDKTDKSFIEVAPEWRRHTRRQ